MFEHLKDNPKPSWPQRIRYFTFAALTVAAVFFLSLWLIAKTANIVQSLRGKEPIPVTYDANEDGEILNEVLSDLPAQEAPAKESEKEPLLP